MTTFDRLCVLGRRISAVRDQIVDLDQEEELRKIASDLYAEASLLIALDDVQLVKCFNCGGDGYYYPLAETSAAGITVGCHVCDGTGWVVWKR